MRWMLSLCCSFVVIATAQAEPATYGHLYQSAYSLDRQPRLPAEEYVPQPGDLFLPSDPSPLWRVAYAMAGTNLPSHSALIVTLPDGTPAVLEAGSGSKAVVALTPLRTWLCEYKGKVWIRRRKTPITAEQSALLTEFALLNDKKFYAILRFMGQVTPFRARGYYRTTYIGKPHGIRRTYYCSEIVLEGMVYAGLMDRETARPTATYPRDMFFDHSRIPHIDRHLGLACDWHVPAFWTWCPCR